MKKILLLMMIGGSVYSQGIDCSNLFNPTNKNIHLLDSIHMGEMTYRVQVLSSSYVDKNKFGKYLKTHRCEVDYCMLPSSKEVYRYNIAPTIVNSYTEALKLMEVLNKTYENPFVVMYHKGKRIN